MEQYADQEPPKRARFAVRLMFWAALIAAGLVAWSLWRRHHYGPKFDTLADICGSLFWALMIALCGFLTAFVVRIAKWVWAIRCGNQGTFRFWTEEAFTSLITRDLMQDKIPRRAVVIIVLWSTAFILFWFGCGMAIERATLMPFLTWIR